jgi:mycothiol synthase
MEYTPQDLHYRACQRGDAGRVLDLIIRCETAEYGEPDSSLEDLLHDWDSTDLPRDSWLAHTLAGELVGYALVMPWFGDLRYDFFVSPGWEAPDLGIALLERCEQRGQMIAAETPEDRPTNVTCYCAHANRRDRQSLEASGFQLVKYHFQMQIRMESEMPPPRWPAGIAVRTAVSGEDYRRIHALIETAFARPGRTRSKFEDWSDAMLRADIFDPSIWFLACEGAALVGACLCYEYPELGWVRQLGVHPCWRGKGLGSALLRQAFHAFQGRGFEAVGLTVDAENENAYIFYQRLGMRRVRQFEQHEKPLPAS